MGRSGNINAAGGFLRAVGERRAGAQGSDQEAALPVSEVLKTLAEHGGEAPGISADALAAHAAVSRAVVVEVISRLHELELVVVASVDRVEHVSLTDVGRAVAERQSDRSDHA